MTRRRQARREVPRQPEGEVGGLRLVRRQEPLQCKTTDSKITLVYKDFKFGKQPASLSQLPAGYRRMQVERWQGSTTRARHSTRVYDVLWSLLTHVESVAAAGEVRLRTPRLQAALPDVGGLVSRAVACLRQPVAWDDVLDLTPDAEGIAIIDFALRRLRGMGLLQRTLVTPEGPLATLVPLAHRGLTRPIPSKRTLSRFAHMRQEDGVLRVETPLAPFRILLHDWRGPALLAPAPPDAVPAPIREAFWDMLGEAGMLDDDPPLWAFHDLVFHAGSRLGRHDRPYGGTYPHEGRLPSPPARPAPRAARPITLPRPELARLQREDPPLAQVVEARRSIRSHGAPPISIHQMGELLFRTLRTIEARHDGHQEILRRPHPNAGALYELEVYLTVDRCVGLPPGMYHYDSHEHALEPLEVDPAARQAMLDFVMRGCGMRTPPQVLLTLTSRLGRLAWKYEAIAYAATLKDVGIVIHNLYLAATAMGLAPCALGGGDADLFAAATGLDYYEETAVGEFMVGTM